MQNRSTSILVVSQVLENDLALGEALFFPELSHFDVPERISSALAAKVKSIITEVPLHEWHRRQLPGDVEQRELTVSVAPAVRTPAWSEPVDVLFHILTWQHGTHATIAYIPALGIEVVAPNGRELEKRLESHIQYALLRSRQTLSLTRMAQLARVRELRLEKTVASWPILTPKEVREAGEHASGEKKSVLARVAEDITHERPPTVHQQDAVLEQLGKALSGVNRQSVLLTGPSGVGKTAVFHGLVRRRDAFGLRAYQFWATSGARLVAGMAGFGMWQERCQNLCREVARREIVLHLGNLMELAQVGKSDHNSQGIAAFLQPAISRGELLTVAECTPEQLTLIEQENPRILEAFHQIKVNEPAPEQGRAILDLVARDLGMSFRNSLGRDAVQTLNRLHRRFGTYSVYPGRPIRFLRNIVRDHHATHAVTPADVTEAFSRETGLPRFMLDESIPLDLAATFRWFSERVIGQEEAVRLVVDLLATAKSRLARPRKPIASLLFIGPTGVGKTEMAKALAAFLFGDKHRLTRFDMSEFADPYHVARLTGGVFGAEGLLTSKAREEPFSVILLDEFEKAHPLFFDLLLQMLGEGRLTDAGGRVADFTNAVIIMTSNLGAQSFQAERPGFDPATRPSAARARDHFSAVLEQSLRPELFNRIDAIVPFAPLGERVVDAITRREIGLARSRDGLALRDVALRIPEEVTRHLSTSGHDPRYGARLLKRIIDREFLVPLAGELNRFNHDLALDATVDLAEERLAFKVRARIDESGKPIARALADANIAQLSSRCSDLRRRAQRLMSCGGTLRIENEIFHLESDLERKSRRKNPAGDAALLGRLNALKQLMKAAADLLDTTRMIEEEVLLAIYSRATVDEARTLASVHETEETLMELLASIYRRSFSDPDNITLAVYSESRADCHRLAAAYASLARLERGSVRVNGVHALGAKTPTKRTTVQRPIPDPDPSRWRAWPGDAVGVVLGIHSPLIRPRLAPEAGVHLFVHEKQRARCLVEISQHPFEKYNPPPGIERRGGIPRGKPRRTYDVVKREILDEELERLPWIVDDLPGAIVRLVKERYRKALEGVIEE